MTRFDQQAPPRTAWTVAEVATSLGISTRQVYVMAAKGELRAIHIGRRVVIPVTALDEFVAAALDAS